MSQLSLWMYSHRHRLKGGPWFCIPMCCVDGHARDLSVHAMHAQWDGLVKVGEAFCLQQAIICVPVSGNYNWGYFGRSSIGRSEMQAYRGTNTRRVLFVPFINTRSTPPSVFLRDLDAHPQKDWNTHGTSQHYTS